MLPSEATCGCGGYKDYRSQRCHRCAGVAKRGTNVERARVLKAQGFTSDQIAERLGAKSRLTVNVWLQRARERQHGAPAR
jgi:hypothetical protein